MSKKINKNSNGFSMLEVVMSVFLISTGLIAAIQLISSGLATSMDSRNQLIATGLTQEGLELVRNIRDNNWANDRVSFANMSTPPQDKCYADYEATPPIVCPSSEVLSKLYLNNDNLYTHSPAGATATKFRRNIKIEEVDGTNRLITSIVSWDGSFPATEVGCTLIKKCVYAQTKLTMWGEQP